MIAQNEAARIKAMAERRAGQIIGEMQEVGTLAKQGGDRVSEQTDGVLVCSDLGLSNQQSSRYQRESKLSDEDFEALVAECNEEAKELTQALIIKKATGAHVGLNSEMYSARHRARTSTALPRKFFGIGRSGTH